MAAVAASWPFNPRRLDWSPSACAAGRGVRGVVGRSLRLCGLGKSIRLRLPSGDRPALRAAAERPDASGYSGASNGGGNGSKWHRSDPLGQQDVFLVNLNIAVVAVVVDTQDHRVPAPATSNRCLTRAGIVSISPACITRGSTPSACDQRRAARANRNVVERVRVLRDQHPSCGEAVAT